MKLSKAKVIDRINNNFCTTLRLKPKPKHKNLPKQITKKIESKNRLADYVILYSIDYTKNSFHIMDDWKVYETKGYRKGYYDHPKSAKKFLSLTEQSLRKKEYKNLFCRIISWVEDTNRAERFGHLVEQTFFINEKEASAKTICENYDIKERYNRFPSVRKIKTAFLDEHIYSQEPFTNENTWSLSDFKKLQEVFASIVLEFGSASEIASILKEHYQFFTANDLISKIDESTLNRDIETTEELFTSLTISEPNHPEITRLQNAVERLKKINSLMNEKSIDIDSINKMSGIQFETLVTEKFKKLGFKAETTPTSGDYGADIILTSKSGTRISVQCKRFNSKVNLKAVQEVIGSLGHYSCDYGIVVTNNSYLKSAINLAKNNDIELWDQDSLVDFISGDINFSELSNL